jgi:hypothetical protein
MRVVLALSLASLVGAIGCGGDPPGGPTNPPVPPGPVSDVTGKIVDIHVTESGDVTNARDPIQYEVGAIVPGEDGAPREILAVGAADGSFVIPDVPEVPYTLRFTEAYGSGTLPPRFIVNAPREVDLGRVFVGRPDAEAITTSPTEIAITATGLAPTASADELEMFSLGSGASGRLFPTDATFPAAGATELANYRVDTSALDVANLVDGSLGDRAHFLQYGATSGDLFVPSRSIAKVFEPAPFSQVDGGSVAVSGAYVDVPEKQLVVKIDDAAFKKLAPGVNAGAEIGGREVSILAEPGGERPTASVTPTLLQILSGSPNALPPSLAYRNPFPPEWAEVASVGYSFIVTHVMPTGIPKSTAVLVGRSGPASTFTETVTPVLGPPENILVNDQPSGGELLSVGNSPTVRWSPPSVGTAAVYLVALRRLDPGGGTTRTVAFFSTTDTSLQIPEGYLDFGYYYYVRIGVRGDWDPVAPLRSSITSAFASALSGVLTP